MLANGQFMAGTACNGHWGYSTLPYLKGMAAGSLLEGHLQPDIRCLDANLSSICVRIAVGAVLVALHAHQ